MTDQENLGEMALAHLAEPAQALGVALSTDALEKLALYARELHRWNQRINLTGARSEAEILAEHVADALALLPHLPAGPFRMVDVGSGAGLPGVPLAVLRPDAEVLLLEPNGKKFSFLQAMRRELPLPRTVARSERLEQLVPESERFDVAVSRAVWAPAVWLEKGATVLSSGGRVLAVANESPEGLPSGTTEHPYGSGGKSRFVLRRLAS